MIRFWLLSLCFALLTMPIVFYFRYRIVVQCKDFTLKRQILCLTILAVSCVTIWINFTTFCRDYRMNSAKDWGIEIEIEKTWDPTCIGVSQEPLPSKKNRSLFLIFPHQNKKVSSKIVSDSFG